nr:15265_t:CDS:1 [Entrophospora candida]
MAINFYYYGQCSYLLGKEAELIVQTGFGQLTKIENGSGNSIQLISQLAEPLPFLAFLKYLREKEDNLNNLLKKMVNNRWNLSFCGSLFEVYLAESLKRLFDGNILKNHHLFVPILQARNDNLLCQPIFREHITIFDYPSTILSTDNPNIFCMIHDEKLNLLEYLKKQFSPFFLPEEEAGPDLVCIVQFKTQKTVVKVPLFLQAKLVGKVNNCSKALRTTNPYSFFQKSKSNNEDNLMKLVEKELNGQYNNLHGLQNPLCKSTLDCLRNIYSEAHKYGICWIQMLVVFPADVRQKSFYRWIREEKSFEVVIIIDASNTEQLLDDTTIEVLNYLKTKIS